MIACWIISIALSVHACQAALAYARLDEGYWQIWTSSIEGDQSKRLTKTSSDKRCLRVKTGSNSILFRDNEGLLVELELSGNAAPRQVLPATEVIKDFDFRPDLGFLISTYAPNSLDNIRIWWVSPDQKQKRLVVAEDKLNEMPRWAGRDSLYFVKVGGGESHIHRTSLNEGRSSRLFPDQPGSTTEPAPSPDGLRLAFCREGAEGMDLWVSDSNGKNARVVYAGAGMEAEPCWMDNETILFSTWDGRNFRVARIGGNGSGLRMLSPEGVDSRYPVFVKGTQE